MEIQVFIKLKALILIFNSRPIPLSILSFWPRPSLKGDPRTKPKPRPRLTTAINNTDAWSKLWS